MNMVKAFSGKAENVEYDINEWGKLGYDVLDVKVTGTGYSSNGSFGSSGSGDFLVVITYQEPE